MYYKIHFWWIFLFNQINVHNNVGIEYQVFKICQYSLFLSKKLDKIIDVDMGIET